MDDAGGSGAVRVLGVGNVLMSDDGFGPYVARVLESELELPPDVEVLDVGTPGLDFLPYLADARAVIIIDTVTGDEPPGTVRVYRREQLLAVPPPPRTNPHQPGLREALMATELTDSSPGEVVVVGVIPASTAAGTALSPNLRAAVGPVIDVVVGELTRLGLAPKRRPEPTPPDIWWED